MTTLELRPMACLPMKPLPDGVLGVPIDSAASENLLQCDFLERARVFSQILSLSGLMVKVGPYVFVKRRGIEYVEKFNPHWHLIFSGIVNPAPSPERNAADIIVLGRIMTFAPEGISFEELCRGNFGSWPSQQKRHRESLQRLVNANLIRRAGSKYVLTVAGVKKAITEGYVYSPPARRK